MFPFASNLVLSTRLAAVRHRALPAWARMAPFAAVIFDNDGLLLDTEQAWTRAEETLFTRRGRTWTMAHKRELIGSSGPRAQAILERQLDRPGEGAGLLEELEELVMEEVLIGVPPRPGALELLAALGRERVPLGLASNSQRPFVERVLGGAGLLGAGSPFGVVVTASDVEHPKPAPDLYLAAAAALGVEPTRCAALEDSPPGAASALAAGMTVIGVPYFSDGEMPEGIHMRAGSLADPEVHTLLGV